MGRTMGGIEVVIADRRRRRRRRMEIVVVALTIRLVLRILLMKGRRMKKDVIVGIGGACC
jgi:hypothetical protein